MDIATLLFYGFSCDLFRRLITAFQLTMKFIIFCYANDLFFVSISIHLLLSDEGPFLRKYFHSSFSVR